MSSSKPPSKGPSSPSVWERFGPGAFAESRFNPYRITAVLVGLALVIAGATWLGNRDSGSTTAEPTQTAPPPTSVPSPTTTPVTAGEAYRQRVFAAYGVGTNSVIITFQQTLLNWSEGKGTDAEFKGAMDIGFNNFVLTRAALEEIEPFPEAPAALPAYKQANYLFLEASRVGRVAFNVPPGDQRDQLRDQVRRLTQLADRTFDAARRELEPFLGLLPDAEGVVEPNPPAEVPDFRSQGLLPGPPLEAGVTPSSAPRRTLTAEDKKQVPFAQWAEVANAAPGAERVAQQVTGDDTGGLATLSRELVAAADALYLAADPEGEHEVNVRVQLALLIQAEASRAAQMATLTTGTTSTSLRTSAQRLALIGDTLWDDRLEGRDTGFPKALLDDN